MTAGFSLIEIGRAGPYLRESAFPVDRYKPGRGRIATSMAGSGTSTISILARQLPEGVWLATSDDVPGLVVETDSRAELTQLAPQLARELIAEDRLLPSNTRLQFAITFI